MKDIVEFMNENNEWCVLMTGGSIGERDNKELFIVTGSKDPTSAYIIDRGLSKDEAQRIAKERNKSLSPGEKKYYGIRYYARETAKLKSIKH